MSCSDVISFINHCLEKIAFERNKAIMSCNAHIYTIFLVTFIPYFSVEGDHEKQQLSGKRRKHSKNKLNNIVIDGNNSSDNCSTSTLYSKENEFWDVEHPKKKKKTLDDYTEYSSNSNKITKYSDNDGEKKKKHKSETSQSPDSCDLTFLEEGSNINKQKKKKRKHDRDLEASEEVNVYNTKEKKKKHKQKYGYSDFWSNVNFRDSISSQEESDSNPNSTRKKTDYLQNNEITDIADITAQEASDVNLKIKKKRRKEQKTDEHVFNNDAECDYVETEMEQKSIASAFEDLSDFTENSTVISTHKRKKKNKQTYENSDSLCIGPQEYTDFGVNSVMYVETELDSIYQDISNQCNQKKKQKESLKNRIVPQGDANLECTSDSVVSTPKKSKKKKHKDKDKEKHTSAFGNEVTKQHNSSNAVGI